jgi:hypothetical protein
MWTHLLGGHRLWARQQLVGRRPTHYEGVPVRWSRVPSPRVPRVERLRLVAVVGCCWQFGDTSGTRLGRPAPLKGTGPGFSFSGRALSRTLPGARPHHAGDGPFLARRAAWPLVAGQSASGGSMSRVAGGHFRRKRAAPLILRGSTSQCRAIPGAEPGQGFAVMTGCAWILVPVLRT